ncbi:MAG: hypothetical protein AAFP84_20910, partial [Actinomycetota bacterium]
MQRLGRPLGGHRRPHLVVNEDAAPPLPKLKLEPARVAVAGLSSGAYMATQAQMPYPELFP